LFIIFAFCLPAEAAAPQTGTVTYVTPTSSGEIGPSNPTAGCGFGENVSFTAPFTDPDGESTIRLCVLRFSNAARELWLLYRHDRTFVATWTKDEQGNAGWSELHDSTTVRTVDDNPFATIYWDPACVEASGTNFTVNWNVVFKEAFSGIKYDVKSMILDFGGVRIWDDKGSWEVQRILSISVSPDNWNIEEVQIGTTTTMEDNDKLIIINNGNGKESYSLSLINPGGWIAGSQPGPETYVLNAAFASSLANISWDEGNHLVTTEPVTSTENRFAGDENGMNVLPDESRNLFLQFKSPTQTQIIDKQSITLTISAEIPAR